MTIKNNTDLGASFERLKKSMNEAEGLREDNTQEGLINAYSRLYVNVEHFVKTFDDPQTIADMPGELYLSSALSSRLDKEESEKTI